MTLLNWIKSRNRTSPLILSQINGLTIMVLICAVVYFVASASYGNNSKTIKVPLADQSEGTVIAELAGDTNQRGIYYLPGGTTIQSLFASLKMDFPGHDPSCPGNLQLSSGAVINIDRDGRIQIGDMTAAKRLALNLPLDINKATSDDLILIPGLKDATAERILAVRQAAGGRISRMEDLLRVKGIKEKRLQRLKQYLFVPSPK